MSPRRSPGLRERLKNGPPLVADGAMGTLLRQRGLHFSGYSYECNGVMHDRVYEVHRDYRAAGAELLLTNTFGLTPAHLRGRQEDPPRIIQNAVTLARKAVENGGYVAGSIGPMENTCRDQLHTSIRKLAFWYQQAGADAIWLETQLDLQAVQEMLTALDHDLHIPILVSFSFNNPSGTLAQGESAREVAATLKDFPIAAMGFNCGLTPELSPYLLQEFAAAESGIPLIVKPNAGLPETLGDVALYSTEARQFEEWARDWLEHGAGIIGGCCGTTPEHIRAIHRAVQAAYPLAGGPHASLAGRAGVTRPDAHPY